MMISDYIVSKRQMLTVMSGQLKQERSSHEQRWRDVAEVTRPDSPRWLTQDTNRGERKDNSIMDCTATMASQTLSAGMMAGITSPARPWFRLTVNDPSLAEVWQVK